MTSVTGCRFDRSKLVKCYFTACTAVSADGPHRGIVVISAILHIGGNEADRMELISAIMAVISHYNCQPVNVSQCLLCCID